MTSTSFILLQWIDFRQVGFKYSYFGGGAAVGFTPSPIPRPTRVFIAIPRLTLRLENLTQSKI